MLSRRNFLANIGIGAIGFSSLTFGSTTRPKDLTAIVGAIASWGEGWGYDYLLKIGTNTARRQMLAIGDPPIDVGYCWMPAPCHTWMTKQKNIDGFIQEAAKRYPDSRYIILDFERYTLVFSWNSNSRKWEFYPTSETNHNLTGQEYNLTGQEYHARNFET